MLDATFMAWRIGAQIKSRWIDHRMAGAFGGCSLRDEWPPDVLSAPPVLSFLKKAREGVRDRLAALADTAEQALAPSDWTEAHQEEVMEILRETQRFIEEARAVLFQEEGAFSEL